MKEADRDDAGEAPPRLDFDARAGGFAARLKRLRVAAILDEFSEAEFSGECVLRQLTPHDWKAELDAFRPDMLLVESAWRGKDGLWKGRIARMDSALNDIIALCRARAIPTVFWNKEDPVHFQTFKRTARQFDYVFTTDIDSIAGYQSVLGHERIFLLPFACQPRLSNPIERGPRKEAIAFAGGFYNRYPDRVRDFAEIIGALRTLRPVEIFDRGQGAEDERYRYPDEYADMIVGTLPFERIDEAYKGYRYGVNFNSIKQSQSMFARRVFELLASNTSTISNYSRGLRLALGDIVIASDDGETILSRLRELASDDSRRARLRLAGVRKVLAEHTAEDRLAYIVAKVAGIGLPLLTPPVAMVGLAGDGAAAGTLIAAYRRQSYAGKRLLLILADGTAADVGGDPQIRTIGVAEAGTVDPADICGEDGWLAPLDPHDHYGPNYLLDLALATRYAPGDVIGKAAHHVRDERGGVTLRNPESAYRPVDAIPARAAIIRATALTGGLGALLAGLAEQHFTSGDILSVDPFGYCRGGGDDPAAGEVDDLPGLDTGLSHADVIAVAERVRLMERPLPGLPQIPGDQIAPMFRSGPFVSFTPTGGGRLLIESKLARRQKRQRYIQAPLQPAALGATEGVLRAHLVATGELPLRVALQFLDAAGVEIGGGASRVNRDMEFDLPEGTATIRFGLRITGPGAAEVETLLLGHRYRMPVIVLSHGDHLILTDDFPSYDEPTRGRAALDAARAARAAGRRPDIFRLAPVPVTAYHEFEGFDCITGTEAALAALVAGGRHRDAEVLQAADPATEILARYAGQIRRGA
jgi:hypothetical protein